MSVLESAPLQISSGGRGYLSERFRGGEGALWAMAAWQVPLFYKETWALSLRLQGKERNERTIKAGGLGMRTKRIGKDARQADMENPWLGHILILHNTNDRYWVNNRINGSVLFIVLLLDLTLMTSCKVTQEIRDQVSYFGKVLNFEPRPRLLSGVYHLWLCRLALKLWGKLLSPLLYTKAM